MKNTLTFLRENLMSTDSSGGLGLFLADRYFFEGGYYERYVLMEDGSDHYYYIRKYDNDNTLIESFGDERASEEMPGIRLIDDIASMDGFFEKSPNACMLTLNSGAYLVMGAMRGVTTDEFFLPPIIQMVAPIPMMEAMDLSL